jgi:hypothetical protein
VLHLSRPLLFLGGSRRTLQPSLRCQRSETDEALVPASLLTRVRQTRRSGARSPGGARPCRIDRGSSRLYNPAAFLRGTWRTVAGVTGLSWSLSKRCSSSCHKRVAGLLGPYSCEHLWICRRMTWRRSPVTDVLMVAPCPPLTCCAAINRRRRHSARLLGEPARSRQIGLDPLNMGISPPAFRRILLVPEL